MSMLGSQIKELREAAEKFEGYQNGEIGWMLREAADTIENMRDRLLKAELACDEKSYDAGFDNGMKATLQQLDGLIHEGADVDEIQAWADRQWEEEA